MTESPTPNMTKRGKSAEPKTVWMSETMVVATANAASDSPADPNRELGKSGNPTP